jgi:hypothetical protein
MRASKSLPVALSLIALFVALGGTGYAVMSTNSGEDVIHACISNRTGAVRIVKGPRACQRARRGHQGERALAWNQRGLPGAVGPVGPAGPSDAYSVQGDSNIQGQNSVSLTLPPGSYIATGGCTAGIEQTSGGRTPLTIGLARAVLTVGPSLSSQSSTLDERQASVPNQGATGILLGSYVQYGATVLSNNGSFTLPSSGTLSETCTDGGTPAPTVGGSDVSNIDYGGLYLTAIRVASLHESGAS